MACSKYEYVKQYEADDRLLPGCWIVVRLDGKGFTKCAAARAAASRCRGLSHCRLLTPCCPTLMQQVLRPSRLREA